MPDRTLTARAVPVDYGVTLNRGDHHIVLLDGIPWPAGLAATVEHLIGNLGAPPPDQRPQHDEPRQEAD